MIAALGVSFLLVTLFYSGFGFNFAGLGGLGKALVAWQHKGDVGRGPQQAIPLLVSAVDARRAVGGVRIVGVPALRSCRRCPAPTPGRRGVARAVPSGRRFGLSPTEWFHDARAALDRCGRPARSSAGVRRGLVGLVTVAGFAVGVSCLAFPAPADWRVRLLAIYAPGTLLAYSIIHYKTPWCAISFEWPFFCVGGALLVEMAAWSWPRSAATDCPGRGADGRRRAGGVVLRAGGTAQLRRAHRRPTHLRLRADLSRRPRGRSSTPCWRSRARDPSQYTALRGVILCGSTYPLPWQCWGTLRASAIIRTTTQPPDYQADFLLVVDAPRRRHRKTARRGIFQGNRPPALGAGRR